MSRLVHIVDDDSHVRASTSYFLASHGCRTEIYSGGRELLRDGKLSRGVILLDLCMPDMSGHEVQEELARRGIDLPVIVVSAHNDFASAVKAMKLGAVDFLAKPPQEEELLAAIDRAVARFEKGRDQREARANAIERLGRLSPRETEILQSLLAGMSNKEIARLLGLSPRTVEMHRANMMDDLGVASLPEAVRIAIDGGLQPLGQDGAAAGPAAPPPPRDRIATRAEDERLLLALEATSDGVWDWHPATGEIVISDRFIERLGYDPAKTKVDAQWFRDIIHPDDYPRVEAAARAHLGGLEETYACEYRLRCADGGWSWQFSRGRIVKRDPATGAPLRMIGSASDITHLKRHEEELRGQAELLALARQSVGIGMWELDLESGMLRLCPRSRELHGMALDGPEMIAEAAWAALVHPDDVAAARAALEAPACGAAGTSISEYRTLAEGRPRWILAMGRVVADAGGRPLRLVGLHQDVSGRKLTQFDRKRVQEAQLRFSETSAIGTMASTLAHELNQPLTAIANFVRGIRRRLGTDSGLADAKLEEALAGTERSAEFASQILGRIRRQAVFDEVRRAPASLSAVIGESCSLALFDADELAIHCTLDLDPRADAVRIDAVQIKQVLLNLLRNAVEALLETPVAHRRLAIVTRRLRSGEVEVRVTDSGPGIRPKVRDKLFEPFTTTKSGGTGLGLSICRTIVEAHGGRIRAEEAEGGDASFRFTLAD